jgi:Protein of unknown function (DUF2799)
MNKGMNTAKDSVSAMRRGLGVGVLGLAALLGGCETTKKQCEGTDWEQAGRSDGASGQSAPGSLLGRCDAEGVAPDRTAYDRGHRAGLMQWCGRDWYTQGRDDGSRGDAAQDMAHIQARCTAVGVAVDVAGYRSAHRQSAQTYCATLDWRAVGRRQFEAGRPADAQAGNPAACAALGVRPDTYLFHAGYDAARSDKRDRLERQCAPRVVFDAGRHGHGFERLCDEVPHGRRAHDGGREHARLDKELRTLETERAHLHGTGTLLRQGRQAQPLPEAQKSAELNRLNGRIRELMHRMDDLARQFR